MSNPTLARNDDLGKRFYTFGDPPESFWSVTTILNGGIPKYLHSHYAKMAAELAFEAIIERGPSSRSSAIVRRLARAGYADVEERQAAGELTSIKLAKLSPRDLALRWVKGAADRHRDAAAARGSAVHSEAEALVLEHAKESIELLLEHEKIKPWPEAIAAYQAGFVNWVDDYHPEFLAAEASVFNRSQAYAGTLDAIARVTLRDGRKITPVIDYKTSAKGIYPEVAPQLASYARGEFIGHPDGVTELPMIATDCGAVLHLTPKGYEFRLVRIDDPIFAVFQFCREVFRWREEIARTVFLQDLTIVHEGET